MSLSSGGHLSGMRKTRTFRKLDSSSLSTNWTRNFCSFACSHAYAALAPVAATERFLKALNSITRRREFHNVLIVVRSECTWAGQNCKFLKFSSLQNCAAHIRLQGWSLLTLPTASSAGFKALLDAKKSTTALVIVFVDAKNCILS